MKLMTKELERKLPKLYTQESKELEALVIIHYFNPGGMGDWYITEGERVDTVEMDNDLLFFGLCCLFEDELGNVCLSQLEAIKSPPFGLGVERDLYWTPKTLSAVMESRAAR